MEASFGGLKFKGGKIFGLLVALSTLVGGLYGAFVAYKDYTDFKEIVSAYVAPDLSGFDKKLAVTEEKMNKEIAVLQTEVDMIMQEMQMLLSEISLISDVANELKNDLRQDLRRVEKIIEDVEQNQKQDSRENSADIKFAIKDIKEDMAELEEKITDIIQKTLANPLAGMK
jgi:predicted  nucleic acid-binding Zn-ribbon protein|tara:strand:- start:2620 stop:3132 length:513 start_codon:yes stop_codon:yes gene_type:complete